MRRISCAWLAPITTFVFLSNACCVKKNLTVDNDPTITKTFSPQVEAADQNLKSALQKCKNEAMSPALMMALSQSKERSPNGDNREDNAAMMPLLLAGLSQKDGNGKDCGDNIMGALLMWKSAHVSEDPNDPRLAINEPRYRDYVIRTIGTMLTETADGLGLSNNQRVMALGQLSDWNNNYLSGRLASNGISPNLEPSSERRLTSLPFAANQRGATHDSQSNNPQAARAMSREGVIEQKMQARLIDRVPPTEVSAAESAAKTIRDDEALAKFKSLGLRLGVDTN